MSVMGVINELTNELKGSSTSFTHEVQFMCHREQNSACRLSPVALEELAKITLVMSSPLLADFAVWPAVETKSQDISAILPLPSLSHRSASYMELNY